MALRQRTLIILSVILILSTFQNRAERVRLCGRRLADFLNFICERHGGFHAPRARRDVSNRTVSKRAIIEILRPLARRTDPDATNEDTAGPAGDAEVAYNYHRGIADECCKKQCTLATMVSYCANVQQVGNIDLEDILPAGNENLPIISEDDLTEFQEQVPSTETMNGPAGGGSAMHPTALSSHIAYSSRPNLGLSPRNRPVFIVLSQLQEEEDRALGEYRF